MPAPTQKLSRAEQREIEVRKTEAAKLVSSSAAHRAEWIATRAEVIDDLLYQYSDIRSVFSVENFGTNNIVYDIPFEDVEVVFMMPQIGGVPTVQVEGSTMSVSTFDVMGGIEVQDRLVQDGNFQALERATNHLLQHHIKMESYVCWALIASIAATLDSAQKLQAWTGNDTSATQTAGSGKFNVKTYNKLTTATDVIGQGGRRMTDIFLTASRRGDFLDAITEGTLLPDELKQQLYSNGRGNNTLDSGIRLHTVYDTNLVPNNKAYVFTEKEGVKFGVMPFRHALETVPNTMSQTEWKIGLKSRVNFGVASLDPLGMIEVTF